MVIFISINTISKSIYKDINTHSVGKVHSVYKNTINIMIEDKLFSIQPNNIAKSPMSVNIESSTFKKLSIRNKEVVVFNKDNFTVQNYKFDLTSAKIWNPQINEIEIKIDEELICLLNNLLKTFGTEEGLRDIPLLLPEVISLIDKIQDLTALKNITNLIGMGQGLTPSVDDFLLGILSVLLNVNSKEERFRQLINTIIIGINDYGHKTTPISFEYLKFGCKNEFSEPLHNFYIALGEGDRKKLTLATMEVLKIGHSSGSDTLSGIIIGLILKIKKEEANNVNL